MLYDDDTLDGINDVAVLNKLRGIREKKVVLRFKDKVDSKRFKVSKHADVINGTAIETKGEL
jgi:calcineurin-like phosphoesterase